MSLCFQSYLIDYVVSQDMIKKVIPLRSEEMLHGIERETLEKAASTDLLDILQNGLGRVCDKDTPTQSYQDGEFDDGKITLRLKGLTNLERY